PDGTVEFEGVLVHSEVRVEVDAGFDLVTPKQLDVTSVRGPVTFVVRRRAGEVSGRVVDEAENPLSRVHVFVSTMTGAAIDTGVTDAAGEFRIARKRLGEDVTALWIGVDGAQSPGYRVVSAPDVVRWGDREIEVVVRPPISPAVRVADSVGRPVGDYRLRYMRLDAAPLPRESLHGRRVRVSNPEGSTVVDGLVPGSWLFLAVPTTGDAAPAASIAAIAGPGQLVDIEVPALEPLQVRVRTRAGDPVIGTGVALVRT